MVSPSDYRGSTPAAHRRIWCGHERTLIALPVLFICRANDSRGIRVEDRAKITPTLQVPALIDGELTIWDSAVIIDYLMTNYLGVAAPESMHSLAADYLCARGGKLARPARSRDVAYLWRVDDNGVAVAMVRDPI